MPSSSRDQHPPYSPDSYDNHNRRMVNKYKKPKSRSALCLLVLCGCAIMFFALVLIGASFAINYDEDFDLDDGDLEAYIKVRFNYDQYWAGVPFLVTGVLVLFSGIFQRAKGLTITTVIFCIISIALSLFVLVMESSNFFNWNTQERKKIYWDSKSDYSCGTDNVSKACKCESSPTNTKIISGYECNIVRKLSALYGSVVGSAIMVTLFSLATIILIIKSLSWKPEVYPSHSYYNSADEFYVNSGRRSPSFIDLSVTKRATDVQHSNGTKVLPYRNYPF